MAKWSDPAIKPDKRKIPELFWAVERGKSDTIYYGRLVDDDHFKFVSWSVHEGDSSIFKERVLNKRDFRFSKISLEDFRLHSGRGLYRMRETEKENRMELEANEALRIWAEARASEIIQEYV